MYAIFNYIFIGKFTWIFLTRISMRGRKNIIIKNSNYFNIGKFEIHGNNNMIDLGKNNRFYDINVFIYGSNHRLIIGNNCILKNTTFWFEDHDCVIIIGDNTTIEGAHIAVTEPFSRIDVGHDCMFSMNIDIRNGDSHSIINLLNSKRINYAKNIRIGNRVWIGKNCTILKGINIGDDSVVGTQSLVTKDIPGNSIAVGSPARVVKDNICWKRERIYDEL